MNIVSNFLYLSIYCAITATTFGIALPKWIVSSEYGGWVLMFYVVLFLLILPIGVVSSFLNFFLILT